MDTPFNATTAMPYPHPERATAELRGRLRLMAADSDADLSPDWETLVVTGPTVAKDSRGNTGSEWAATVQATAPNTNAPLTN